MSTVGNYAPIKKEYLVKAPKREPDQEYLELESDSNVNVSSEPPRKKRKANERGQNKSRAKRNKIRYDILLCPDLGRGKTCKFGDKCKYCHDIAKYLKCDKPSDIGPRCIFFEALGECPQGYFCRFANHHIDQNTLELITTKKEPNEDHKQNKDDDTHYVMTENLNVVSSKAAKFLNRNKAHNWTPFPITQQIMKFYKEFNDAYHPTKRRRMYDRMVAKAKEEASEGTDVEMKTKEDDKWDTFCHMKDDKVLNNQFVTSSHTQSKHAKIKPLALKGANSAILRSKS
eukprot:1167361_1